MKLKIKGMEGEQRISMNTSALESKITAYKLFQQISENLGTAFAPYAETLLPQMLQDLNYQFSKAIRKYAMKVCVNLLHAVGEPLNVAVF
jgi:BP28CT (NUC211) domain